MTVPQSNEQLAEWLKATTLSERRQKVFLKRFEQEGAWTDELAESFVDILFQSLRTYEEELSGVVDQTHTVKSEIDDIEAEIEQKFKESMPQILESIDDQLANVDRYTSKVKKNILSAHAN